MNSSIVSDFISTIGIIILVIVGSTSFVFVFLQIINAYLNRQKTKRKELLNGFTFPIICYSDVQQRYPHLTSEQVALAFEQLRLYFEVCLVYSSPSSSNPVAMPSKLIDVCWHSFICNTREYQAFCRNIFGAFLHHESKPNTSFPLLQLSTYDFKNGVSSKPTAEAQSQAKTQQERDLKKQLYAARIYQWVICMSRPEPSSDTLKAPFLFSIDQELNIEDGYFYSSEMLEFLAKFDFKAAEAIITKQKAEAANGATATCADGGSASCGGCGGSI